MTDTRYDDLMIEAEQALAAGNPRAAYRGFGRAHDRGHAVRRQHFAAHRGMIRAAARARRYDRCVTNAVLLAAGFLFDHPAPAPVLTR